MIKINKHIAIVRSSRRTLSSLSAASAETIFQVLKQNYSKVSFFTVNSKQDLQDIMSQDIDTVFLGMQYVDDLGVEDSKPVWLANFFEQHDIPTTGSVSAAHRLESDKSLAKMRVLDNGLKTAQYYISRQPFTDSEATLLPCPLFVKPKDQGGGAGIDAQSVVHDVAQLNAKIKAISDEFGSDSLVEKFLPGREFSVAILANKDNFSVMPIELVAPADEQGVRILSNAVKSADAETAMMVKNEELNTRLADFALAIFHALGARDYGRIDIRLDADGVPHFLEANLMPSLIADYGSFPKACTLHENLSHSAMIVRIVNLALGRQQYASHENTQFPIKPRPLAVLS